MSREGESYVPSNGTEGVTFMGHFCLQCIHEKFSHTMDDDDRKCEILTRSMVTWPDPLIEWVYDQDDFPTCTEWKQWDWGRDDDGNWNDPDNPSPPEDPMQLMMPFTIYELMGMDENICVTKDAIFDRRDFSYA